MLKNEAPLSALTLDGSLACLGTLFTLALPYTLHCCLPFRCPASFLEFLFLRTAPANQFGLSIPQSCALFNLETLQIVSRRGLRPITMTDRRHLSNSCKSTSDICICLTVAS